MKREVSISYSGSEESSEVHGVELANLLDFFVSKHVKQLHTLKFSNAVLTPDDIALITPILPSSLQTLDLTNLGLTPGCIDVLSKRIIRTHVSKLDLSDNPIGDGSVWMLLDYIGKGKYLKSLSMARCGLTSSSVFALCTALGQREFDFIDLSGNLIGVHGAVYIHQFLETDPRIKELHIDDCELGEGDMELLVQAIDKCSYSEVISMTGNQPIAWRKLPEKLKIDLDRPMR